MTEKPDSSVVACLNLYHPRGGGGLLPYMGYIGTDTAFMIGDAYLMLYPSRGLFHGNVKLDIGF